MGRSKEERKERQKQVEDEDDYDQLARDLFLDGKTYAKKDVSIKDPKQLKKDEKRREKKKERIFSDDEENEEEDEAEDDEDNVRNDDELEENVRSEKRGIGYEFDKKKRKTEKLNAFLSQLQEIKRKKLVEGNGEDSDEEDDADDDLEPSSEEEEDYDESDNE